jgi:hypothetical protein
MILLPSAGRDDWRRFLADPSHWKVGKSAYECATAWEAASGTARGLPPRVAAALDSHPSMAHAQLLIAIPELKVDLPPGGHASQNDVWALLRVGDGTVSMAIEAKCGEALGPLVRERLAEAPPNSGVPARLAFLRTSLGLDTADVSELRYQLLHRAVSALIQAERFAARTAVLLIQSFGGAADDKSREDYQRFAQAMGCTPAFNAVVPVGRTTAVPLLNGWLTDAPSK